MIPHKIPRLRPNFGCMQEESVFSKRHDIYEHSTYLMYSTAALYAQVAVHSIPDTVSAPFFHFFFSFSSHSLKQKQTLHQLAQLKTWDICNRLVCMGKIHVIHCPVEEEEEEEEDWSRLLFSFRWAKQTQLDPLWGL